MQESQAQHPAVPGRSGRLGVAGGNVLAAILLIILTILNAQVHQRVPALIGWLPSGLALATVVFFGPRMLPGVFAGVLLALLASGAAMLPALLNAGGCALACWLVWRVVVTGRDAVALELGVAPLSRLLLVGMGAFVLITVVLGGNAVSRILGHTHSVHAGASSGADGHGAAIHAVPEHESGARAVAGPVTIPLRDDFLEWLLSDAIGVLLVLPVALQALLWRRSPEAAGVNGPLAWAALSTLIVTAVAIYSGFIEGVFGVVHTTLLVLPPAVWLALEYGVTFTLVGNLVVPTITGIGTALGYGPFKDHSAGLAILTVVYLITTLMILASSVERRRAAAEILRLAMRDALTGLPNRKAFTERVEQALAAAQRHNRRVGLLFIDLDNFKTINDTLGHAAGDQLLLEAATRVQGCLRKDSTVARFGGDEMVVLVEQIEDEPSLTGVAERIAEAMAAPFILCDRPNTMSCSIGISRYPEDGATVAELMRKADIAMYEVKTSGRKGYRLYARGMDRFAHIERRTPAG